jgi:hypothetical protein
MVRHQAIRPEAEPGGGAGVSQEVLVEEIVAVFEEYLLAAVAALCDVIGNVFEHDAHNA